MVNNDEVFSNSHLLMDRAGPLGNSLDASGRRALHTINFTGGFVPPPSADSISATYPTSSQEVYQYFQGGLSGILLMTVTVNYTDSTKNFLLNAVRT